MMILMKARKAGTPALLTFYGGGHGVTNEELQILTLNSSEPKNAVVPIQ